MTDKNRKGSYRTGQQSARLLKEQIWDIKVLNTWHKVVLSKVVLQGIGRENRDLDHHKVVDATRAIALVTCEVWARADAQRVEHAGRMPTSGGHQEKARMPGPPGFWFSIAISRLREIPLINRCVSYFYIIVTRVVGHSFSLPQQRTCVEEFMKAYKQQRPQPTSRVGIVFKGPNDLTSVTRTQLLRAPQLLK